jgi:hypothetical protein
MIYSFRLGLETLDGGDSIGVHPLVFGDGHVLADHKAVLAQPIAWIIVAAAVGEIIVEGPAAARAPLEIANVAFLASMETHDFAGFAMPTHLVGV